MNSGIYKILNKVNGKFYIGSAINFKQRWVQHKHHLNNKTHKNKYLQSAYDKYWLQSFEFVILEYCDKSDLIEREQYWINITGCCDREIGYNLNPTAGSMLGFKHSEETKEKFRNKIYTDEIKVNMSKGQTGKTYEFKPRGTKGKPKSEQTKAKMSAAQKGKIISLEARALISVANSGRKLTPEQITKRTAARRNNSEPIALTGPPIRIGKKK